MVGGVWFGKREGVRFRWEGMETPDIGIKETVWILLLEGGGG